MKRWFFNGVDGLNGRYGVNGQWSTSKILSIPLKVFQVPPILPILPIPPILPILPIPPIHPPFLFIHSFLALYISSLIPPFSLKSRFFHSIKPRISTSH